MAKDDPRVESKPAPSEGNVHGDPADDPRRKEQIDAALRDSERHYRDLIGASNQVLYRHNADWSEMRQLSGGGFLADTEQPDPDWFRKYIHIDDQPAVWTAIEQAVRTRSPFELEHRVIREDGSLGWTLSRSIPIFDEDGEVVEWFGMAADVTERKRGEERLRESEDRLRLAAEAADVGTWDFSPATGVLRWDERCKRFFGLPPDAEVTYEIFLEGVHPEDRAKTDKAVQRALEPDGPGEYDVEYRTIGLHDKVERWMAAKGRAIFEGEGPAKRAIRFIGTVIDISDKRRAADQLSEESHNLEILNRIGAAIAGELDLERVVQLVTDAGVELTGAHFGAFFYNVVNDSGESYTLYTLSGVDRSHFDKFPMPRNTHVFGPTFRGEGVVRSDDITKDPRYGKNAPYYGMPKGHLPVVSYLAVPVISRTGEVIGGLFFGHPETGRFKQRQERLMEGIAAQAAIAIDKAQLYRAAQHEIEQRVKAEQALSALNETLESRVAEEIARRAQAEEVLRHAQKMETVGQLSGGIAHDFNNLLQIIHGNLTLLQRALPPDEPRWQRSVGNALTGTERAAALTQRLLAFSRRQPLDARPVDVNAMIADMIELLHRTLGEPIAIETRLSADIPSALVDGNQLENAILNLAINARDAMPQGGELEISTDLAELDAAAATAHADASPGRYVRITVTDTGEGMSPQVLQRAVEPFFSTKEVGQGTGLGLSMVYGFAKQSGGHLILNSVEGEGTAIELYVPCSKDAAVPRAARQEQAELPAGNGERILLCEDDADVRQFSSETLSELGYDVVEAHDAESALKALATNGPIDLLFTDIVLPGGRTGADLAREALAAQPQLKVLFATGYARSALEERQGPDSEIALLLKPFGVEELATKLRTILDA